MSVGYTESSEKWDSVDFTELSVGDHVHIKVRRKFPGRIMFTNIHGKVVDSREDPKRGYSIHIMYGVFDRGWIFEDEEKKAWIKI